MNGKAASMQDIGLALSTRLDAQSSAETLTQTAWASSETLISRTYYTRPLCPDLDAGLQGQDAKPATQVECGIRP